MPPVSGSTANSTAALADTLTFKVAGASSSTITDIGVQFTVHGGGVTSGPNVPIGSGLPIPLGGGGDASFDGYMYFGVSSMKTGHWLSDAGVLTEGDASAGGDWTSSKIVSDTNQSINHRRGVRPASEPR